MLATCVGECKWWVGEHGDRDNPLFPAPWVPSAQLASVKWLPSLMTVSGYPEGCGK